MSEDNTVQVNFGKAIPLFPLDSAVLLPQQVLPLHIFEPRYRQMVERALDGAGQIAMAVFEGESWKQQYHGRPALRPAVCIGQIVQHERLPDGRYNIILQGVCRARIGKEAAPDGERLYREAVLQPVGLEEDPSSLVPGMREYLEQSLEGPLRPLAAAGPLLEYVQDEKIPTHAIMELVSFTVLSAPDIRYRLLEEGDVTARAEIIRHELDGLARVLRLASHQWPTDWPKGCSWN